LHNRVNDTDQGGMIYIFTDNAFYVSNFSFIIFFFINVRFSKFLYHKYVIHHYLSLHKETFNKDSYNLKLEIDLLSFKIKNTILKQAKNQTQQNRLTKFLFSLFSILNKKR
jgi:hypothetical protein